MSAIDFEDLLEASNLSEIEIKEGEGEIKEIVQEQVQQQGRIQKAEQAVIEQARIETGVNGLRVSQLLDAIVTSLQLAVPRQK